MVQKLESEEERMINNLMYIKLKTGYSDDGSAWIGYVKTSKSKKIIYFNDHAFQKNIGNYIDIENGHEYWISGLKKREQLNILVRCYRTAWTRKLVYFRI